MNITENKAKTTRVKIKLDLLKSTVKITAKGESHTVKLTEDQMSELLKEIGLEEVAKIINRKSVVLVGDTDPQ